MIITTYPTPPKQKSICCNALLKESRPSSHFLYASPVKKECVRCGMVQK